MIDKRRWKLILVPSPPRHAPIKNRWMSRCTYNYRRLDWIGRNQGLVRKDDGLQEARETCLEKAKDNPEKMKADLEETEAALDTIRLISSCKALKKQTQGNDRSRQKLAGPEGEWHVIHSCTAQGKYL
jgi:hypothetical protein